MKGRYANSLIQISAGLLSFGIFIFLRFTMPTEEFHSVAALTFAGSFATALINLNLDRKYFSLVENLKLSASFWLTFHTLKWFILASIVLFAAFLAGAPFLLVGVIFYISQTMTELYPKGYFEDKKAGPQSVIVLIERIFLALSLVFGYWAYFIVVLPFRMFAVACMWLYVFAHRDAQNLVFWRSTTASELLWNIRTYLPVGFVNSTILQVPIWLGGISNDARIIADLAILRQSIYIPRQLAAILTRLFHNWVRATTKKFLTTSASVAIISVVLSLSLFIVLDRIMGREVLGPLLALLHAFWSVQIVVVLFISKRMSLLGHDNHILFGATVALMLSAPSFWLLKMIGVDLLTAYVVAVAVPHLIGVTISWYLGTRRV